MLQLIFGDNGEQFRLLVKGILDVGNKLLFALRGWYDPDGEREHLRFLLFQTGVVILVVAFTLADDLGGGFGVKVYFNKPPVLILPGDRDSKEVGLERLYRTIFAEGAPALRLWLERGEFHGLMFPAELGQADSHLRYCQRVREKIGRGFKETFGRSEGVTLQINQTLSGVGDVPDQPGGTSPHTTDTPGEVVDQPQLTEPLQRACGGTMGGAGGCGLGEVQSLELSGEQITVTLDGSEYLPVPVTEPGGGFFQLLT